jgi:hypothetical protein
VFVLISTSMSMSMSMSLYILTEDHCVTEQCKKSISTILTFKGFPLIEAKTSLEFGRVPLTCSCKKTNNIFIRWFLPDELSRRVHCHENLADFRR